MKPRNMSFFTIILLLFIFETQLSAQMQKPECMNRGSINEGWAIPGENSNNPFGKCSDHLMECQYINTQFEGWYLYEKKDRVLLEQISCTNEDIRPLCIFEGTPLEAWVIPARGMRIYYQSCVNKTVECGQRNFEVEGWYMFEKKLLGLYKYSHCSQYSIE